MPSTDFKSINRKFKNDLVRFAKSRGIKIHVVKQQSGFDVTIMCGSDVLGTTGF